MSLFSKIIHRLFSISNLFLLYRDLTFRDSCSECDFDFRFMADDNCLKDTSSFENSEYYAPIYSNMIKKGDVVIFGYMPDNTCVFRACVQLSGRVYNNGCFVRNLEKNEGYVHYIYCDPNYRRKGIHNKCLSFINQNLSDVNLFAIVKKNNTPSLLGFYKNGYVKVERLKQINIIGFRKLISKEISK